MWLFIKIDRKNESQSLNYSQKKNSNLTCTNQQESHLKNGKRFFLFHRIEFKKSSHNIIHNFSTLCEIHSTRFRSFEISLLTLRSKKHQTDKRLQHSQLPQTENGKTRMINFKKRLNITVLLHGGDLLKLLRAICRSERKSMLNDTWKQDHGMTPLVWKDTRQRLLLTKSFFSLQIRTDQKHLIQLNESVLMIFQLMIISKNSPMSEQTFTKEQMFACWMKSAEKSKVKWERLDRDYEKSCFERWLPTFTP